MTSLSCGIKRNGKNATLINPGGVAGLAWVCTVVEAAESAQAHSESLQRRESCQDHALLDHAILEF